VVGLDHTDMWPRFEEGVRAMRAYLTPGAPPFQGRFYDTSDVRLEPVPVQRPCLPIWIGSWGSDAGLRRVARLADGWMSSAGPGRRSQAGPHAHDMVGTRAGCLEKVRRWKAAGARALFLGPRGPDPLGQMRLFLDEVASKA